MSGILSSQLYNSSVPPIVQLGQVLTICQEERMTETECLNSRFCLHRAQCAPDVCDDFVPPEAGGETLGSIKA